MYYAQQEEAGSASPKLAGRTPLRVHVPQSLDNGTVLFTIDLLENFYAQSGLEKGKVTKKVYDLITRRHFLKAINVLTQIPPTANKGLTSKVLSLLAYCHYQECNFSAAAQVLEQLWTLDKTSVNTTLQFVHCLAKDGHHHEASRVIDSVAINSAEDPEIESMRIAISVQSGNLAETEKYFEQVPSEDLSCNYVYGYYLYHKKRFLEASQVFQDIAATEECSPDAELAATTCMYHLEEPTTCITKAAGIYDAIVQTCPSLAPTYDDDRTMVCPDSSGNVAVACQIAALLMMQAACYFQQGHCRSARRQLILIPTSLPKPVEEKIDLSKAVLENEVDSPKSIAALLRLTHEATVPSVRADADRDLLLVYLRHGYFTEAGQLVDTQEASLRQAFSEADWLLTEATLIASIDAMSARNIYTQFIDDTVQDIEQLQNELAFLREEADQADAGEIEKMVSKVAVSKKSLRMAVIGLVKLYYDKGYYVESARLLQKHLDHCQDDLTYCIALAHCLFMAKNYPDASFIYETIIKYYKETQFTLVSVPVSVLSSYCAAQIFATADDSQAKETLAELLRSEKVNFEDPESEYHIVAAKRTHSVSACLLIASIYLNNGSFLEAFRKAKEVLHLHPWHLTEENNSANNIKIWCVLKRIFLVTLRRFTGLLMMESTKMIALLPDVISDLADMQQFSKDLYCVDGTVDQNVESQEKSIAEEAGQVRRLCQMYYNHRAGLQFPAQAVRKLRLPLVEIQALRDLAGLARQ